ncbi:hypothetical protein [Pseudomonas sp. CFBP 13710]|uniref:hypothetical protein n=1 Tax=Pseudomonas sp. CFBP 13710 TaxID=2775311 RepID=UPI00178037CE|nr:hypothetical protein [Pseudomonas sp. CFBP 13710]MBD8730487.1 hypothetical protein [Pseudomonas sp. CFBP 13710]
MNMLRALAATLLLALPFTPQATANEIAFTARIDGTRFVNTTPRADYCAHFGMGSFCATSWSTNLPITYRKRVDVNSPDARDKVYVRLPARRAITLQNQLTGETATMFLSFYQFSQRVSWVHETVVNGAPSGCGVFGSLGGGPGYSRFLWYVMNSTNPAPCFSTKSANPNVEDSEFTNTGISVRPEFPAVGSLAPGDWEGIADYRVGLGQDFDFGNILDPSTDHFRVRISFKVMHEMRVDFPAHGTEIRLVPQGSWASVMNTSKAPVRLYHDSPLRLWAGSAFKVYLACEHDTNRNLCRLKNQTTDHYVPVNVAISLPGGFGYAGRPVDRLPLLDRIANAKTIVPTGTASNAPGTLHFDVSSDDAVEMLRYPGARYSGWVTIIYDANP